MEQDAKYLAFYWIASLIASVLFTVLLEPSWYSLIVLGIVYGFTIIMTIAFASNRSEKREIVFKG